MNPAIYVRSQRHEAPSQGHQWELNDDEAINLVTKNCSYCGDAPFEGCGSIDRVDNNRGYVRENCVPSCGYCNTMKGSLTKEKFLSQVEKINAHQSLNG